jgi:hypothetical protein
MKPQALLLPGIPLVLAALGWWSSASVVVKLVKHQPAPVVTQITLPPGIDSLQPAEQRPPLGYLELAAFGFTEPPKVVAVIPRKPAAGDLYVVDSVLSGNNFDTAIIGDLTVKVGDKLDKTYTVAAISRDGVWVRGKGKRAAQERIGFRPFADAPEQAIATVTTTPPKAKIPEAAVPIAPDGSRDFRQVLELLKL